MSKLLTLLDSTTLSRVRCSKREPADISPRSATWRP